MDVFFIGRKYFIFLLCYSVIFFSPTLFAQSQSYKDPGPVYADPIHDVTIVALSTLGGAVLGLSTLSFVDEPGEHLNNIVVGGALGLILGVTYVAYNQSTGGPEMAVNYWSEKKRPGETKHLNPSMARHAVPTTIGLKFSF